MEKEKELLTIYDNAKSFYKKAKINIKYDNKGLVKQVDLLSYNYNIATIKESKLIINTYIDKWDSQTSLRHLKEFIKQYYYIFNYDIRKQLDDLKGNITKKDIQKIFL